MTGPCYENLSELPSKINYNIYLVQNNSAASVPSYNILESHGTSPIQIQSKPVLPDPGPGDRQSPCVASLESYQSRVKNLLLVSVLLLNPK